MDKSSLRLVEKLEMLKKTPGFYVADREARTVFSVLTGECSYTVAVVDPAEAKVLVLAGVLAFLTPRFAFIRGASLGGEADFKVGWVGVGASLVFDLGNGSDFSTSIVLRVQEVDDAEVAGRIVSGMMKKALADR